MKIKTTLFILVILVSSCTLATKNADNKSPNAKSESAKSQSQIRESGVIAPSQRDRDTTPETRWVSTSVDKASCRTVQCRLFRANSELYALSDAGHVLTWKQRLGVASFDGLRSGRLELKNGQKIELAKPSNDDAYLAVLQGKKIIIFRRTDWKVMAETEEVPTKASSFDFSPNNDSLLIGGTDGRVYLWHYQNAENTARPIERYIDHNAPITSVVFHPAGDAFFSADWNGVVTAWRVYQEDQKNTKDFRTNPFLTTLSMKKHFQRAVGEAVDKLYITVDGEALIAIGAKGSVELWRTREGKNEHQLQAHQGIIQSSAFNGQLMQLVTVGRDGFIRSWRISTFGSNKWQIEELKNKENRQVAQIVIQDDGSISYLNRDGGVSQLAWNE